jgi:hypothetical protein
MRRTYNKFPSNYTPITTQSSASDPSLNKYSHEEYVDSNLNEPLDEPTIQSNPIQSNVVDDIVDDPVQDITRDDSVDPVQDPVNYHTSNYQDPKYDHRIPESLHEPLRNQPVHKLPRNPVQQPKLVQKPSTEPVHDSVHDPIEYNTSDYRDPKYNHPLQDDVIQEQHADHPALDPALENIHDQSVDPLKDPANYHTSDYIDHKNVSIESNISNPNNRNLERQNEINRKREEAKNEIDDLSDTIMAFAQAASSNIYGMSHNVFDSVTHSIGTGSHRNSQSNIGHVPLEKTEE